MDGSKPVLRVRHDLDDPGWQFLTGENVSMKDAMLVALHEVVSKDASLNELADMPPGWLATRACVNEPWKREIDSTHYEKSVQPRHHARRRPAPQRAG
jgi:hypothetical protein